MVQKKAHAFLENPRFVLFFYCLATLGILFYHLVFTKRVLGILYVACMPLYLLIPPVFYKVFRLNPVPRMTSAIYIFSFLAFGVGVACFGYLQWPFSDKVVHFLSGYFFSIAGLILFYYLKPDKILESERDWPLASLFCPSFSALVAVFWEIFEYLGDVFFQMNNQHVPETGVGDTMGDLIACMLGAMLFLVCLHRYFKRGKKAPLFQMFDDYLSINIVKEKKGVAK